MSLLFDLLYHGDVPITTESFYALLYPIHRQVVGLLYLKMEGSPFWQRCILGGAAHVHLLFSFSLFCEQLTLSMVYMFVFEVGQ